MKTIFVSPDDWNSQYDSAEDWVSCAQEWGEIKEGDEFELIRLEVGALTRWRVVDGKPTPISVAFPDHVDDVKGPQP